jgi:hypothetical protein
MGTALSRRAFLGRSLALAVSLPLAGCSRPPVENAPKDLRFFTPQQWQTLDAAAQRLVPGVEQAVATTADQLFAQANPRLKADLQKLLDTFENYTFLGGEWGRFSAMSPERQDRYLLNWQASSLGVKRQAFVGLNRLAGMLYYMEPRSWARIGYAGPWVGRIDVGLGLDNQGELAANPNPNVFKQYHGRVAT